MKKKKTFAILIFLLAVYQLPADVISEVEEMVARFTREFQQEHPDLVFRPNVGVLPFGNDSPEAEKHRVGQAVSAVVEDAFSRSILFNLIDDKIRDKLIKEIKFSLTGLAETERIEPGKIEGIDYFVDGSVTQLGNSFTITMRVVEVNSSQVISIVQASLPKAEIIDYSQQLAAAYVSPYGLGLEFYATPFYHLTSKMSDIEGQIVEGWPFGFTLNYRVSRNLVIWLGFEGTTGAFRLAETYETSDYPLAEITNMDTVALGEDSIESLGYKKERTYTTARIGLGWVINFTRNFNTTLGVDLKVGMSFLQQYYHILKKEGDYFFQAEHLIDSQDITFFLASPLVKLQYYLTPRMTLNAAYSFGFQILDDQSSRYYYANQGVDQNQKIEAFYALDPGIDPSGNSHSIDFTGHRITAGIGFYF